MSTLLHELTLAWRSIRRQPAMSLSLTLTVGLAVAANTALFSVFDGLMFRPLPFPDADRIVHVELPIETRRSLPTEDLRVLIDHMTTTPLLERRVVAHVFAAIEEGAADVEAWGLRPVSVTEDWFPLLGIAPIAGRHLFDGEDTSRVVISESLWRTRYGANRDLIGSPIDVPGMLFDRRPTLWGVMPAGFSLPDGANLWFPSMVPLTSFNYARLAPNVTIEQVRSVLPAVIVTPLREHLRPDGAVALAVLLGATALLLLVAWVQVAGLLFARAAGRVSEIGVRLALGASRGRVIRQFAIEGVLMACGALLVALIVAPAFTHGVITLLPEDMTLGQSLTIDGRAAAFAVGTSLIGVLILTLVPVDIVRRSHPLGLLRGTVFGTMRVGTVRTHRGMLVAQLAVTVVLMYMAGLTARSATRITDVDLGFTPDRLVGLRMPPVTTRGGAPDSIRAHIALQRQRTVDLLEALRALPGVETVAEGALPFATTRTLGSNTFPITVAGHADPVMARLNIISAEYPAALELRVLEGRVPGPAELAGSPGMALVNHTLARQLAAFGPVVGQQVTANNAQRTIVGVVADYVSDRPDRPPTPELLSIRRSLQAQPPYLVVKVAPGDEGARALAGIRATFDRIWVDNPSRELYLVPELAARAVSDYRARATMLALIGVLSLPLAVVGIAGALTYAISQRRRDIAVRLALGAQPADIQRMVIRSALAAVGLGLAGGLVAAVLVGRLISAYLFGVRAADPVTLAAVVVVLIAVTWMAAWLPSRRAGHIAPAAVLRAGG